MDPNFIKLYKMSQLIIEYLLVCSKDFLYSSSERRFLALSRSIE